MPSYIYKCTDCEHKEVIELPMSSNPNDRRWCKLCREPDEEKTMTRRIGVCSFPKNVGKVFAGDWYKKTYGQELGADAMDKSRQAEDKKTLEREFRKMTRND